MGGQVEVVAVRDGGLRPSLFQVTEAVETAVKRGNVGVIVLGTAFPFCFGTRHYVAYTLANNVLMYSDPKEVRVFERACLVIAKNLLCCCGRVWLVGHLKDVDCCGS